MGRGRPHAVAAAALGLLLACADERPSEPKANAPRAAARRIETDTPDHPTARKGYTEKPPGTPKADELLLTEAERRAAAAKSPAVAEREAARRAILDRLEALDEELRAGLAPEALEARVEALRAFAVAQAREGRVLVRTADELYRDYAYPSDPAAADATYAGRPVLLTGTVVPPHVTEIDDLYKLYDDEPAPREPLLLETSYDLAFVRVHLLAPEAQRLRDWQPVALVGIVEGKAGTDVVVRSAVVLR